MSTFWICGPWSLFPSWTPLGLNQEPLRPNKYATQQINETEINTEANRATRTTPSGTIELSDRRMPARSTFIFDLGNAVHTDTLAYEQYVMFELELGFAHLTYPY